MTMRTRATSRSGSSGPGGGPRVVIFDAGDSPRVEVVDLPPSTEVGSVVRHAGGAWRIVATRTRSRVLIAVPVEH